MEIEIPQVLRKQERLFRLTFIVIIFSFPLSTYISESLGIESSILSIASRAISLIVVLYYLLFLFIQKLFKPPTYTFWLFILFWILYSFRILNDTIYHSIELGRDPELYYLFGFVLSFFTSIPLFIYVPINETKLEKQVFFILIILTLLAMNNSLKSENLFMVRLGGNEKLNPITTGLISSLMIVLSLRRLVYKKKKIVPLLLNLSMIGLGLVNLLIVSSKSSFIFIGLVLLMMLLKELKKGKISSIVLLSLPIFLVIIIIILGGYAEYINLALYRFTEASDDQSNQERIILINGAVNQFFSSPIFGSFLEEKTLKIYPHNVVLDAFMAMGILGGALYLVIFLKYIYNTITLLFKSNFNIISIMAFAHLLLGLTSGSLSFHQELWYFIAIISFFSSSFYYSQQFERSNSNPTCI